MIDLIKAPVATEKSLDLITARKYVLDVDRRLTKPQIKKLCAELFHVQIASVNTHILPKHKRGSQSTMKKGAQSRYKRAIITLPQGEKLNRFSNVELQVNNFYNPDIKADQTDE